MNKNKQLEAEIKHLAAIENSFKALGKHLYKCWLDEGKHNFENIMFKFHLKLTKLKETKKCK